MDDYFHPISTMSTDPPPQNQLPFPVAAEPANDWPTLQWTENMAPNKECRYDHCIAESPFGQFLITWKSWKDYDCPTVDKTPWGDCYQAFNSVDEAKAACQQAINERLARWCRPVTTPPLIVRYEFEITDEHDETVASGDAPTLEEAEREGRHYLAKYQQDGPCTLELRRVEVLEVSRTDSTPTQASEPHADEELSDLELLKIGCKELGWLMQEWQLRNPGTLYIDGYYISGTQLLSALRAAITADRARRRSQEILAVRDRLFPSDCADSVDYLLIRNELTAKAAKAEAPENQRLRQLAKEAGL